MKPAIRRSRMEKAWYNKGAFVAMAVACTSIPAKVYRDRIMKELASLTENLYGWRTNKGIGSGDTGMPSGSTESPNGTERNTPRQVEHYREMKSLERRNV